MNWTAIYRNSGGVRQFGEVVFAQLIDESGNASFHAFTPETWRAFDSGDESIRWTVPAHELTGPLPEEMARKL